jgi:hypothetical protein
MGLGAYFAFRQRAASPPPSAAASAPEPAPPPAPPVSRTALGGEPYPVEVPALDASDQIVRELLSQLSKHPRVTAWLATDGLVRSFAAVVTSVSEGALPTSAKGLQALRPAARLQVVERGGQWTIDPKSFTRYNAVADAVASIDPAGAARLYATLRPRLEDAHAQLGTSTASFDITVERAIVRLLETPAVTAPLRVTPEAEGIGYAFVNDRLESLSSAQKQLLRMGPRNVQIIQARLREIALALGIPDERLPH